MDLNYLDSPEYKNIPMYKMEGDREGDENLPIYIRRYFIPQNVILHRHQYFQINYVYEGKAKHFINNNDFDIIKGDIFIIPPYVPHCIKEPKNTNVEIFEFEFVPEFLDQSLDRVNDMRSFIDFMYIEPFLVSNGEIKPRLNLVGKAEIEVENLLNEVLAEYTERKQGFVLLIKSLLLKLLVLVGREFTKELEDSNIYTIYDRHRDAIFSSIEYIKNHYTDDLDIEDIAKKSNFSVSYFRYVFKSITSQTFTQYVNRLRLCKAMELLKSTDDRVLDICLDVGFNNVDHFCRLFRQSTGVSPLEYRKGMVENAG